MSSTSCNRELRRLPSPHAVNNKEDDPGSGFRESEEGGRGERERKEKVIINPLN